MKHFKSDEGKMGTPGGNSIMGQGRGANDVLWQCKNKPKKTAFGFGLSLLAGSLIVFLFLALVTLSTAEAISRTRPKIAYDKENNRYLVVFVYGNNGDGDIYGQFIRDNGTPIGSEFGIATVSEDQGTPSVAYDSLNKRFFVVFTDENMSGGKYALVFGVLLNADGTIYSDSWIPISNDDGLSQGTPDVVYDSKNERFIVVWNKAIKDNESENHLEIYGQYINPGGTPIGVNFKIGGSKDFPAGHQMGPSIAYDSINDNFLVSWQAWFISNGWQADLFGRLGAGGEIVISGADEDQFYHSLAYGSENQRYLVVWDDPRGPTGSDIYGQFVNANGTLHGGEIDIARRSGADQRPSIAYSGIGGKFLVVWETNTHSGNLDIDGQYVDADGLLIGTNFSIYSADYHQRYSSVAYNSRCSNFMAAFADNDLNIRTVLVGDPCKNFKLLEVTVEGTGSGTVTSNPPGINCGNDCNELYENGAVVNLTAIADAGSVFAGWSGDCSGVGDCSVTMDADKSVVATFKPEEEEICDNGIDDDGDGLIDCEDSDCPPCNDYDLCTTDSCVNGQCISTPVDCDDGDPCTTDYCHNGLCTHTPINCDDHDPCTIDSCVDGLCIHTPIDCDDHDPCTTDYCHNGLCTHTPIDCDDHDPCTTDFCDNGQCIHTPIDCNGPDLLSMPEGQFVVGPASSKRGKLVRATLKVKNQGDQDSGKFKVKTYLSEDEELDAGDTLTKTNTVGNLEPGKIATIKLNIKQKTSASGKYLISSIDADEAVEELIETNNLVVELIP